MLTTTLREIRSYNPCADGWKNLLNGLRHKDMVRPITYVQILEFNGVDDCLWAIDKTMPEPHRSRILRLAAVAFAQDALRLMEDARSRDTVRTAHLFAHGEASDDDLVSARASAEAAARAAEAARAARAAAETHQAAWLRAILEQYGEAWGGES